MKVVMRIQKERQDIEVLIILIEENIYEIHLIGTFCMIDGKMRKLISGLGGALCLLCTCTRLEASGFCPESGMERVKAGFAINR